MQKNTIYTIVIVVVLVVFGIILMAMPKQSTKEPVDTKVEAGEEVEVDVPVGEEALLPEGEGVPEVTPEQEALEQAEQLVPEGSLVTDEGEVLNPSGEEADNTASPGSPKAPKQSRALKDGEVPESAVQLNVSSSGFDPNEFTVNANSPVTLSVTSTDRTHVFKFDDAELKGVAIGIAGGETRAITFQAPLSGDYSFFCDVPGHRGRGETGVMHVK